VQKPVPFPAAYFLYSGCRWSLFDDSFSVKITKKYTNKGGFKAMKKFAVLLALIGMLMLAVSMAQAKSDWAYYKEHPVKICDSCTEECYIVDGYQGPRILILDSVENVDGCELEYYTLDCYACHGPDAPGNHDGPQFK
jgi:hypothetical protein